MGRSINLKGKSFGLLYVVEQAGFHEYPNGRKESKWLCRCDCGNYVYRISSNLKRNCKHLNSCGCQKAKAISRAHKTHGMSHTRLYNVYVGILERCFYENNSQYYLYGDRGITICEEWLGKNGFQNFYNWAMTNGYDENAEFSKCTIDRIDPNGNYEPSNCRWVTMKEQARNKRNTKIITAFGETKPFLDFCEEYGINRTTVNYRVKNLGMSYEEALTAPLIRDMRTSKELISFNGEDRTISQWAEITGISRDVICKRIYKLNWSVEEALTRKVRNNETVD